MNKRVKLELSVGMFVFIALIIMVYFVFRIGSLQFLRQGYTIKIYFGFANGVKVGAPVRLAGVDVGEVKNIRVFYDPGETKIKAEILAWLDKSASVPKDSLVLINTLGLLGEKYIEILPGKEFSSVLTEGSHLVGQDPITMQAVTDMGKVIVSKLEEGLTNISKLSDSFNLTLKETNDILAQIKSGKGTMGKLLYDDALYEEIDTLVQDIRQHPWKFLYRPKEPARGAKK
jgi:phospholipid/cholesterol/gamma-HCH transport system substrate-binding protein